MEAIQAAEAGMSGMGTGTAEAGWMRLFDIVKSQFPYCKMKDVRVLDGSVISYGHVEFTRVFSHRGKAQGIGSSEIFDEPWRRFMRFCRAKGSCTLAEVHFREGRPVVVHLEQEGRSLEAAGGGARSAGYQASGGDREPRDTASSA